MFFLRALSVVKDSDPAIFAVIISTLAGLLLSMAVEYIPGLRAWYDQQEDNRQRLIMLGFLLLGGLCVLLAGCTGITLPGVGSYFPCNGDGVRLAITSFLLAMAGNVAGYQYLPRLPKSKL